MLLDCSTSPFAGTIRFGSNRRSSSLPIGFCLLDATRELFTVVGFVLILSNDLELDTTVRRDNNGIID